MNNTLEKRSLSESSFEVMAPVGSYEALSAAINAGADSVYFGIEALNMRARSANNFSTEDLFEIVRICKQHQVRSYLTVNTILYDEDLPLMREILKKAQEAEVTAVIVADVAALQEANRLGLEVHLSTQLNISNIESLRFYAQFADVVVLARELSMEQVATIHHEIETTPINGASGRPVQIEMFAHGALCMAISGKCYLSLHEMNKSANRGSCTQICRRSYRVWDDEAGVELDVTHPNIMSPKDLKTIHFINRMMEAGVRVFKIEGRARGPEYVDTVVRCYKEAIAAVCSGSYTEQKIAEWDQRLSSVFNRGFWDGYYLGQKLGEWTPFAGSSATKEKEYIAKVIKHFGKIGVAEIELESGELNVGDQILIIGPTTGVIDINVAEIRYELAPVTFAKKGQRVSLPVPQKVRPADRVYLFKDRNK
ncbi:MAG: peptidase U32 family protein [Porphyromonas sp.]|nr:peptidase U32 family protein [Porphyromonas sp.]